MTWDGQNRLYQINSGTNGTYTYAGSGARLKKVVGTTQTLYFGDDVEISNSCQMTKYVTLGGFDTVDSAGLPATQWGGRTRPGHRAKLV